MEPLFMGETAAQLAIAASKLGYTPEYLEKAGESAWNTLASKVFGTDNSELRALTVKKLRDWSSTSEQLNELADEAASVEDQQA